MKFTLRNERGLHCSFCGISKNTMYPLYETSPIKGIVCKGCKNHLINYLIVKDSV